MMRSVEVLDDLSLLIRDDLWKKTLKMTFSSTHDRDKGKKAFEAVLAKATTAHKLP